MLCILTKAQILLNTVFGASIENADRFINENCIFIPGISATSYR